MRRGFLRVGGRLEVSQQQNTGQHAPMIRYVRVCGGSLPRPVELVEMFLKKEGGLCGRMALGCYVVGWRRERRDDCPVARTYLTQSYAVVDV